MVGGLDLAADDPLGGGEDDLAHPGGHLLDGGLPGDDHLGVGRLHDAVVDGLGVGLGPELGLVGGRGRLGHDLPRLGPRLLEQRPPLGVGLLGVGLGPVGRFELAADLVLALGQRLVEDGQDVLADDSEHGEEGQQHHDERPIGDEEVVGGERHGDHPWFGG